MSFLEGIGGNLFATQVNLPAALRIVKLSNCRNELDNSRHSAYNIPCIPPHGGWGLRGLTTMLDSEKKQTLINRLKSIEGHVRGIERMVEDDAYCMDILKQVKAVQQALERVSALTLENHLNTCVTTAIRSDDDVEKERVVTEIMDVFKATGKL
jgi:CsoR family transcriptional regulator, copper-sensing transcriptional repressor